MEDNPIDLPHKDLKTETIYATETSRIYKKIPKNSPKTKYVLNSYALSTLDKKRKDIKYFFSNSAITDRLAQTKEKDTHRIFTKEESTNESLKYYSIDDFFENGEAKKINLAKILLSKMYQDQNLKNMVEDLKEQKGFWSDATPDKIKTELNTMLTLSREENKEGYEVILKMIDTIEDTNRDIVKYKEKKKAHEQKIEQENLEELLEDITHSKDEKIQNILIQELSKFSTYLDVNKEEFKIEKETTFRDVFKVLVGEPKTYKENNINPPIDDSPEYEYDDYGNIIGDNSMPPSFDDAPLTDENGQLIDDNFISPSFFDDAPLTDENGQLIDDNSIEPQGEEEAKKQQEKVKNFNNLLTFLRENNKEDIFDKPIQETLSDLKKYHFVKSELPEIKNKNLKLAIETLNNYGKKSNEYPLSTLSLLADEESHFAEIYSDEYRKKLKENILRRNIKIDKSNDNIEEEITKEINDESQSLKKEIINIEKNIKTSIIASLKSEEEEYTEESVNFIYQNVKNTLVQNKKILEKVYDPSKSLNKNKNYLPTAFTPSDKSQDDALNILKDSLYLSFFKVSNPDEYKIIYDNEKNKEEALFKNTLNTEFESLKPNSDKIIDIQNAYLYLSDVSNNNIDKESSDEIMKSVIFKKSSILDERDKKSLKKLGNQLGKREKENISDNQIGMPSRDDLSTSIMEMEQLALADKIEDTVEIKGDFKSIKGSAKRLLSIADKFLKNNRDIVDFSNCMNKAKNPTTQIETTSSLSRGCMDELKDKLRKDIDKSKQTMEQNGGNILSSMNFALIFIELMNISKESMLRKIDMANDKIEETAQDRLNYVYKGENPLQQVSRFILQEALFKTSSNYVTEVGQGDEVGEQIEQEATTKILANENEKAMEIDIKLNKECIDFLIGDLDIDSLNKKSKKNEKEINEEIKIIKEKIKDKTDFLGQFEDKKNITIQEKYEIEEAKREITFMENILSNLIIDGVDNKENNLSSEIINQVIDEKNIIEKKIKKNNQEIITLNLKINETSEKIEKNSTLSEENKTLLEKNKEVLSEKLSALILEKKSNETELEEIDKKIAHFEQREAIYTIVDKLKEGKKINIKKDMSDENTIMLLESLTKRKEQLFENSLSLTLENQDTTHIEEELLKINSIIPQLQKNLLLSKDNLLKVVDNLSDKYHIKIDKETMIDIEERGLNNDNIQKIMKNANKQLSLQKGDHSKAITTLFNQLINHQTIYDILKTDKEIIDGDLNNLSRFQKASFAVNPELKSLLKKSNGFYYSTDKSHEKEIIEAGVGMNGYILKKIDRLQKEENRNSTDLKKCQEYVQRMNIDKLTHKEKKDLVKRETSKEANSLNIKNSNSKHRHKDNQKNRKNKQKNGGLNSI